MLLVRMLRDLFECFITFLIFSLEKIRYPEDEDFFSIVYCVKVQNSRVSKGDLAHYIAEYICDVFNYPLFILLNNYEIHKSLSIFDQDHAESAPDHQVEGKTAFTYFEDAQAAVPEESDETRAAKAKTLRKSRTQAQSRTNENDSNEASTNDTNDAQSTEGQSNEALSDEGDA
jgi:hypothetical protein